LEFNAVAPADEIDTIASHLMNNHPAKLPIAIAMTAVTMSRMR
jgi:hypothetical protein